MNRCHAFLMRAMGATKEVTARFYAMTDDFTAAMVTFWSQRVDGALEAIKIMRYAGYYDFQWFVVVIPANFTLCHKKPIFRSVPYLKSPYRDRDFRARPAPFGPVRRLQYLPRPTSPRMFVHPAGEQ